MKPLPLLVVLVALFACARDADMVPLNPQAEQLGIPKLAATLYGTGYGPISVTMPDGEVLSGHYRLAVGGAVTAGFASTYGRGGSAAASSTAVSTPLNNPFTAQATGTRGTTMICEGSAGGMGHGDAVCTMRGGAQYQMMF
jgi:hypothetical protein